MPDVADIPILVPQTAEPTPSSIAEQTRLSAEEANPTVEEWEDDDYGEGGPDVPTKADFKELLERRHEIWKKIQARRMMAKYRKRRSSRRAPNHKWRQSKQDLLDQLDFSDPSATTSGAGDSDESTWN